MGAKIELCTDGTALFTCPGCNVSHGPTVGDGPGPRWRWNGSVDRPTFTPSILVRGTARITEAERDRIMAGEKIEPRRFVCHSFVADGRIQFLGDCTHALAGQTVDLPDWEG